MYTCTVNWFSVHLNCNLVTIWAAHKNFAVLVPGWSGKLSMRINHKHFVDTNSLPDLAWKKCKQTGLWFILVVNFGLIPKVCCIRVCRPPCLGCQSSPLHSLHQTVWAPGQEPGAQFSAYRNKVLTMHCLILCGELIQFSQTLTKFDLTAPPHSWLLVVQLAWLLALCTSTRCNCVEIMQQRS